VHRSEATKALTIGNPPPDLAEALEQEKRRRGKSLNQTVVDLLGQGLGTRGPISNGLRGLAGGWSEEELQDLERATAQVDAEVSRRYA